MKITPRIHRYLDNNLDDNLFRLIGVFIIKLTTMKKNKLLSLSQNEFIELVNGSDNIKSILIKLEYTLTGYNYMRIKKMIDALNLKQPASNKLSCGNHRIMLSEILVENSKHTNNYSLKKRLVREGILEYECKCGNIGEWNGRILTLQLEHKNGINNDNRIENLEFLCPNCHSQTLTYAGRNSKSHQNMV